MGNSHNKIWVKDGYDSWGAYGNWYEDGTGGGIEYVRADIHDALKERADALAHVLCDYLDNEKLDNSYDMGEALAAYRNGRDGQ